MILDNHIYVFKNMHLHKHEGTLTDTVFADLKAQQIISLGELCDD